MSTTRPAVTRLADYAPPPFLVERVHLFFDLGEDHTGVRSSLEVRRNPHARRETDLRLDGQGLPLLGARLDGEALDDARVALGEEQLTVRDVPDRFRLELETRIEPQNNTALEGLYRSAGTFCTQCEAQGFRRITWFPDRPDVMSVFTTTITADRDRYPVLLSNGDPVERGELEGTRHFVTWRDPFPKPSYLFALVAGDLARVEDTFTTRSGRRVALHIHVEHHNRDRCDHAMASLKKAMRWDEDTYGLEYDLDTYMIVAVDDFNMGAMENKGLNVFNSKYVLARPDTATDQDFAGIEGVIAHEYFHNWTGNRVTCRDWFQLSLKEGLTVFRDQEFSGDVGSRAVKRIQDVRLLRTHQFAEDAGPMAHPVRPDSYIEISNFYTVTVYNKGAEVIRMMQTILGDDGFRRGMRLYFERHDGQAVTTEDFVRAMEDANGADLGQFRRWYTQAGTPVVSVRARHDAPGRRYDLELEQRCPATPGQPEKEPFHIPLRIALLDGQGNELRVAPEGASLDGDVLHLTEPRARVRFEGVDQPPHLSVGRGFSAPVTLEVDRGDDELAFLMAHDGDAFSRWDAAQDFALRVLLGLVPPLAEGREPPLPERFVEACSRVLDDRDSDRALLAETLTLPSEGYVADQMEQVDVDAIHAARRLVRRTLASRLREAFERVMQENRSNEPYRFAPDAVGRRALCNLCLGYLMELDDPKVHGRCATQLEHADNMTDQLAALGMLANCEGAEREDALALFEQRWRDDPLVLDKWFTAQATSRLPDTLTRVQALLAHPRFDVRNPNRVRSLIGAFCQANPVRFHAADGSGYRFAADQVLAIDPANPQVAARLLGAFSRWRRFDPARQALMREALERVLAAPGLSRDCYEVASKTLA
jgi:aminopeptidase N